MSRRLAALGLLVGCGRIDFAAHTDGGGGAVVDVLRGTYSEQVMAAGPRAYYHFDETSGTVAVDASGNGFDGMYQTFGGLTTLNRPGALSGATGTGVRFDGDGNAGSMLGDARMQFVPTLLDWSSDFTVEMFALPHMAPPVGYGNLLMACEVYLTNGFRFAVGQSDQLSAWANESGGVGGIDATNPIGYGAYLHVVLVQKASTFTIYLDGQVSVAGALTYVPPDATSECGIGSFNGLPSATTFDELALYSRALSASEIVAHAAAR